MVSSLYSRELGSKSMKTDVWPISVYNKYKELKVVRGHKAAVYCLLFDRSSSRMITGSDDKLVKIWGVYNGRLIKSLRGHLGDITDLAINYDNSILASADNLHSLRLWNFNEYLPIAVLQTDSTTFIGFSPSIEYNFLISTDEQGTCKIWNCEKSELDKETIEPISILTPPIIPESDVNDKHKILCCSITKGGSRFVTSGDNVIRMWSINPPSFLCNLVGHTAPVRTLQWNSASDRLLSGSEDSTVRIWYFENNKWNNKIFKLNEDNEAMFTSFMVLWSYQDRYILSSCGLQTNTTTQSFIKIWDTSTGQLIHTLKEHSKIVYSLEIHPQDKNIFLSAGYDGLVILWDIIKGIPLQKFQLYQDVELTDAKFSSDGLYFATSDIMGFLTLYGTGLEEYYKNTYKEQFLSTDYNPLIHDVNGIAIDQNTQLPPHLMEIGQLCDWTGDVHPIQPLDNVNIVVPYNYDEFQFERMKREESLHKEIQLKYLPANPLEAPIKIVVEKKKRRNRRTQNEDTLINTRIQLEEEEEEEPPSSSDSDDDKEVSFSLEEEDSDEEMHYNNTNINKDNILRELRERESVQKKDMEDWIDDHEEEEEEEHEEEEEDYYEDKQVNRSKEEEEEEEEIIYDNSEDDIERNEEDFEEEFDEFGRVNTRLRSKEMKKRKLENKQTQSSRLRRSKRRKAPLIETKDIKNVEEEFELPEEEEEVEEEELPVISISSRRKKTPSTICPTSWANWLVTVDDNTIYSPQVGDRVYFFAKGHEAYSGEDKLPKLALPPNILFTNKDLCQISNIIYNIYDPTYCTLDLVLLMNNNSSNTNKQSFQVNFLPGSNFPDWLVLASRVEESIKFLWKEGIKFKMLNGVEEPWEGTVDKIIKQDYQSDPWESFQIGWNVTFEILAVSPWEIDPLNEETNTFTHFKHDTKVECISSEEIERLLKGLKTISEFKISNEFYEPVSIEDFPAYLELVAHPMDLSTIVKRLQNNYYRSKEAFLFDCKLIYQNALLFNEHNSSIVQDAAALNTVLLDLFNGIDPIDSITTTTSTTSTTAMTTRSSSSTPRIKVKPPRKPLTIKLRKNVDTWEAADGYEEDISSESAPPPTRSTRSSSRLAAISTSSSVPDVEFSRRSKRRSTTTHPINYEELELDEEYMWDNNNNNNNINSTENNTLGGTNSISTSNLREEEEEEEEEEYVDIENEEEEEYNKGSSKNKKDKQEDEEEETYFNSEEDYDEMIDNQRRRSTRLLASQLAMDPGNKKYHLRER